MVFLSGAPLAQQIHINDLTRQVGAHFISSEIRGVFGSVFCDLGESFTVLDPNDLPAATSMVASITKDNPGVVSVLEDTRHGLDTGDVVTISDVEGMTQVGVRSGGSRRHLRPCCF